MSENLTRLHKSPIRPEHYFSETIFQEEQQRIFKKLWQFVCLKSMVAEHNHFVTRTFFGIPVVIQNFHGEIKAFENTCLHRQNPLQWEPMGKRALVCRYHGWGYNSEGKPENIPFHNELYRFEKNEHACLKLREFPVEQIGGFIFIHLGSNPLPIQEQFSLDVFESLASISNQFDDEVMMTTFHLKCNWKLIYENLRDGNHVRFVHASTLNNALDFSPVLDTPSLEKFLDFINLSRPLSLSRERALEIMRSFSWMSCDGKLADVRQLDWYTQVERWNTLDEYINWLAYPNLHIASGTGGHSFIIEHHIPIAADKTDMLVYFVTAKKRQKYSYSPAVLYAHMVGGEQVLYEDFTVMEKVQSALCESSPSSILGDYEILNHTIHQWYVALMEGDFEI